MIKKRRDNRFRSRDSTGGSSPIWLTTINDMITILMVFFVLLFAVSQMNSPKSGQFLQSVQSALGVLKEGSRLGVGGTADSINRIEQTGPSIKEIEQSEAPSETPPEKKIIDHPDVTVVQTAQKLYITVADRLLFRIGSAELNPVGYPVLDKVAETLQQLSGQICIEGHTDTTPIQNSRFPSNWELSVARAVHVLNYFIQYRKMDSGRFSVAGYGDSRPVASNDSPESRGKNRRVSIIIEMENVR
ncbi:MAG: flagellar motor protein MotB [Desulfatirhabdiaceae bacterium]